MIYSIVSLVSAGVLQLCGVLDALYSLYLYIVEEGRAHHSRDVYCVILKLQKLIRLEIFSILPSNIRG